MTDEGEPGRHATTYGRMVTGGKNPADDILIYGYSESELDLRGDTKDIPTWDYAASYRQPHESNPGLDLLAQASRAALAKNSSRYFR
jgi:hypothetical protein